MVVSHFCPTENKLTLQGSPTEQWQPNKLSSLLFELLLIFENTERGFLYCLEDEFFQQEAEEEERQKRLGPGGLDPVEVFETLPDDLKQCFESQNIELLQETLSKMSEEDAKYHMKRCIDSGLWVPDAKKKQKEEGDSAEPTGEVEAGQNSKSAGS